MSVLPTSHDPTARKIYKITPFLNAFSQTLSSFQRKKLNAAENYLALFYHFYSPYVFSRNDEHLRSSTFQLDKCIDVNKLNLIKT